MANIIPCGDNTKKTTCARTACARLVREQIVMAAQAWIGTPWRHQASKKQVGTDCLGLVRGVWREVIGTEPEHPPPYTPDWAEAMADEQLLDAVRRHFVEITPGHAQPGDILLFRMESGHPAKHCAIVSTPDRIIHAWWERTVCETRLVSWWHRRIAAAFSFPGTGAVPVTVYNTLQKDVQGFV